MRLRHSLFCALALLALAACAGARAGAPGGAQLTPALRPHASTSPSPYPQISVENAYKIPAGSGAFVQNGKLFWFPVASKNGTSTTAFDAFDPANGKLESYKTSGAAYRVVAMTAGTGGTTWFAAQGASALLGQIGPRGALTTYAVPTPGNEYAAGIAHTPTGVKFFTYTLTDNDATTTNYLCTFDAASGTVTQTKVSGIASPAPFLAATSAGTTLYVASGGGLAEVTAKGVATAYPSPKPLAGDSIVPGNVLIAHDGSLRLALTAFPSGGGDNTPYIATFSIADQSWRYTLAGDSPTGEVVNGIALAPDETLWFSTSLPTAAIGKLSPAGGATWFSVPSKYQGGTGTIVVDGANIWLQELDVPQTGAKPVSYLIEFSASKPTVRRAPAALQRSALAGRRRTRR